MVPGEDGLIDRGRVALLVRAGRRHGGGAFHHAEIAIASVVRQRRAGEGEQPQGEREESYTKPAESLHCLVSIGSAILSPAENSNFRTTCSIPFDKAAKLPFFQLLRPPPSPL